MKTHEKHKRLIFAVIFISLIIPALVYADDIGSIAEELEAYNVTLYAEKSRLPLDELVTLEGAPYAIEALRGKYVLINLLVTWCPYCRREKPSMERLYTEENRTLAVLTVSLGEDVDTVKEYMRENQYSFPVAVDMENKLRGTYAPRLPTSYILDPEGNIIARINGSKEWDSKQALKVLRHLAPEAARM